MTYSRVPQLGGLLCKEPWGLSKNFIIVIIVNDLELEASCLFWLLLWTILKRLLSFVCCLCIIGEVERPLQSRDCAGRVPLTLGHFIHRNFPS